jgi:2-methylcitrate dehydratase PrpD
VSIDITRQLARFALQSRIEQIPAHVRHEATRAFVNWIGSPIGACRHDTTERALAAFAPFSGKPEARLLGRGGKLDIFNAALVNCVASGVYDYDDTHLCEHQSISGGAFLNAFALGIEVQCRLANALAVAPAKCDNAWFLTGITGGVGAAIATGRVIGLDEQQMIWAIGIAAMRAAGPRETHGSMAKNLVPAWAAQEGMQAAFLAQRGCTTSDAPLEGPRGLGHLYASAVHWPALIDGLGANWELLNNAYKPFPSGIVMHAAITGAVEIAREYRPDPAEIERVDLIVHPMCRRHVQRLSLGRGGVA